MRRTLLAVAVLLVAIPAFLLPPRPAAAQQRPAVVVTPGSARSFRVAIQRFADLSPEPDRARAEEFSAALAAALAFSGVFESVAPEAFLGPEETVSLDAGPPLVCSDWSQIGADALVQGELRVGLGQGTAECRVWDTARCKSLVHRRYRESGREDLTLVAKRIADDIVEAFIGVRGVASTELAFVSTRGGNSEIYVMDADGGNARAATANRSINNFPAWSPEGNSILYTSYRSRERPLLYLSTRGHGRAGRILQKLDSRRPQYRGVFDPTGKRLAVVMSVSGAAEIFTVQPDGRRLRRLTKNRAIDISPSWSPDGKRIAFVSDRTGSPQIYLMGADGDDARRLTFQGSYNTGPAWSPDGHWIAYESRLEGKFDIWLIDPEGNVNVPLVSHPRSDESPTWAPNARKLAFSSTRRGREEIYVIDVGGGELRRLTQNAGDNTSPAWGPFPR